MAKTTFETALKNLEKALAERYTSQKTIRREGDIIVIPSFMDLPQAAKVISEFHKSQEEGVQTMSEFTCHPHDGLVSFYRAVKETFGELMGAATETFFGTIPGKSMTISLGHGDSIIVPIGHTEVPGLPIEMNVRPTWDVDEELGGSFNVVFSYPRKYQDLVERITELTNEKLRKHSIFQGKAIDSSFDFLDLSQFRPDKVVYSKEVERQVMANILAPIQRTKEWRELGSPLKRGVLLSGPYGTGKTLTALLTAYECEKNGWTFINVRSGADISQSLRVARRYAPSVVFFEDIDQEADGERDEGLNEILNTVDGLVGKTDEVMVILTTNHIERVNRAMLRPGRLDSLIMLKSLDERAVKGLVVSSGETKSGTSLLAKELDFSAIYHAAEGYPAAFVTEAVTKAKAYALARGGSLELQTDDIVSALEELRPQFSLMESEQHKDQPQFEAIMKGIAKAAVQESLTDQEEYLKGVMEDAIRDAS